MASINKNRITDRVAFVVDTAHGAQAMGKDLKEYIKNLRKAAGVQDDAGDQAEFLRDFGGGI